MKKITNRLFCTLILLCAVGVFAGCSLIEPVVITRESFIGTWEAKFFYFIFYENGTWVSDIVQMEVEIGDLVHGNGMEINQQL